MDRTRARITQAAIELHGSIGPAATTMSAVAERAGVTRATLYRHFPNEGVLFTACSAEWRSANPSPDPAQWAAIADPHERLATALPALYSWYRSSEAMRTNLLRDLAVLPPVIRTGIESYPRTIAEVSGRRLAASITIAPGRYRPRRRLRDLAVAGARGPERCRGRAADHRADLNGRSPPNAYVSDHKPENDPLISPNPYVSHHSRANDHRPARMKC